MRVCVRTLFSPVTRNDSHRAAWHIINRDPVSREKYTVYAIKKYLKHTARTSNYISSPLPPPQQPTHEHTHTHTTYTLQRDGRLNIIIFEYCYSVATRMVGRQNGVNT